MKLSLLIFTPFLHSIQGTLLYELCTAEYITAIMYFIKIVLGEFGYATTPFLKTSHSPLWNDLTAVVFMVTRWIPSSIALCLCMVVTAIEQLSQFLKVSYSPTS